MKKIISLFTCLAIFLLPTANCLLPTFSYAQAPQKFNYQGVARGSSGNVFSNQLLGFKLSILQGSATGTAVYVEVQAATSDSKGIFSLEVGGGTVVSGVFSSIGWGGNSYWLKTEIDTAGGNNYQTMGTTQMVSVPYSLYANSTSNAGFSNMQVFSTAGTFTFTVPAGVTKIMMEVWGGGGGGGNGTTGGSDGGGGGGGGYGKEIFSVTPGTNYVVTVGAGGGSQTSGGNSSFGALISATGGGGAVNAGTGGGGTSSASFNVTGGSGSGTNGSNVGGLGGASSGSYGGVWYSGAGVAPGGGGGGGDGYNTGYTSGGSGGSGRVVVWW